MLYTYEIQKQVLLN